jgi:HSP20 family protein
MTDKNRSLMNRSMLKRPAFPTSWPAFPTLWEDIEDRINQWMGFEASTGVTISEDDEHIYVEAQLPGLKADDLDISTHQNTLWIKGEREEQQEKDRKYYRVAQSSFFYQVNLPSQVEEEPQSAEFQNGILTITFNKTRAKQVHKINIGGSKTQNLGSSKGNMTNKSNK